MKSRYVVSKLTICCLTIIFLPYLFPGNAIPETLRPTQYTDSARQTVNPEQAYDTNLGTYAYINTGITASPSIRYHTWEGRPSNSVYESLKLCVSRSSTNHRDDRWGIKYTNDGGSSWNDLDPLSSANISPEAPSCKLLSPAQDLTKLQVRVNTQRVKTADTGHVSVYDIWTEGTVYVAPPLHQSHHRFFKNVDSVDLTAVVSRVSGSNEARAIAVDQSSMYVAGYEPGKWRIEKRSLLDGRLVASATSDSGGGDAYAIAIDSGYMYVAGDDYCGGNFRWRIEKRRLDTLALDPTFGVGGVVISDPSAGNDSAYAVAIDPAYMYVVGTDRSPGPSNAQWRIEVRYLNSGALLGVALSNPSVDDDAPLAIAIDETDMYVVGYDRLPGSTGKTGKGHESSSYTEWRIEKRQLSYPFSLERFATSSPDSHPAWATGVAVDAGSIYVIGSEESGFFDTGWRTEKRDRSTLELVSGFGQDGAIRNNYSYGDEQARAIVIDPASGADSVIYVAGYSSTLPDPDGTADTEWRIEKRYLTDGTLVTGFGTSGTVINDIYPSVNDRAWSMALDPAKSYMYVAGYDSPALPRWRVEKRDLGDGSSGFLVPLSSQDTEASIAVADTFRLRMLIRVDSGTLPLDGQPFKLQFRERNSADWFDVTSTSDIAFWDNPTPRHGDAIVGNREDPRDDPSNPNPTTMILCQTYVEEDAAFTNAISAVGEGQSGLWDFSLHAFTDLTGKTYEFRIVKENGSLLDGYDAPLPSLSFTQ
jgi:hypothetical protein